MHTQTPNHVTFCALHIQRTCYTTPEYMAFNAELLADRTWWGTGSAAV